MSNGILIVVSAPSGGGKTTIVKELRKEIPHFHYSVSLTTRLPRPGEKNGEDYYFVTPEEFKEKLDAGELIESAQVHEHWYGTPKSFIEDHLKQGDDIILDIDMQGGKSIRKLYPDSVLVCIAPPSFDILESRLRDRGQDNEATIQKRLQVAQMELNEAWKNYDYLIINDQIDVAVDQLRSIIIAEHRRMQRNKATLEKTLAVR